MQTKGSRLLAVTSDLPGLPILAAQEYQLRRGGFKKEQPKEEDEAMAVEIFAKSC